MYEEAQHRIEHVNKKNAKARENMREYQDKARKLEALAKEKDEQIEVLDFDLQKSRKILDS